MPTYIHMRTNAHTRTHIIYIYIYVVLTFMSLSNVHHLKQHNLLLKRISGYLKWIRWFRPSTITWKRTSMTWHKTAIIALLTYRSYCSLALSHSYIFHCSCVNDRSLLGRVMTVCQLLKVMMAKPNGSYDASKEYGTSLWWTLHCYSGGLPPGALFFGQVVGFQQHWRQFTCRLVASTSWLVKYVLGDVCVISHMDVCCGGISWRE